MGSIASGILGLIYGNKAADAQALGYNDAMQGIINQNAASTTNLNNAAATSTAQVQAGADKATGLVNDATGKAISTVNDATAQGNNTISNFLQDQKQQINPYLDAGQTGVKGLTDLANENRQFNWDPSQVANDPAFQFRMQQGNEAIQNSAASRGLLSSGNTLKDLTSFGSGTAAQFENQDFNQALSQFNTNFQTAQNSYLPLAQMGQTAVGQNDQAIQNAGTQIAGNTINAGTYGGNATIGAGVYGGNAQQTASQFAGDTTNSIAKFIASLGSTAAKQAGDYRVGQGDATAGKDLNTGSSIGSIVGGGAGLYNTIAGLFGGGSSGGSGNVTNGGIP